MGKFKIRSRENESMDIQTGVPCREPKKEVIKRLKEAKYTLDLLIEVTNEAIDIDYKALETAVGAAYKRVIQIKRELKSYGKK